MQLDLISLLEKVEDKDVVISSANFTPKLDVLKNGIKITVGELPSRVRVYDRFFFENGELTSRHYQEVRNYWYSLMRKVLQGYQGKPIDPALIYIQYYMPKGADVGNHLSKFIIDGIMYAGGIVEDNVQHLKVISEGTVICEKGEERTEIYIVKYNGGIADLVSEIRQRASSS
jgi:hypothetical protein